MDFNSCPASLCSKKNDVRDKNKKNEEEKFGTFSPLISPVKRSNSSMRNNRDNESSPVLPCSGPRRPSILITDSKTRSTQMNYYKKRVSFGDILYQREFDVEGGFFTEDECDDEDDRDSDDDHEEKSHHETLDTDTRSNSDNSDKKQDSNAIQSITSSSCSADSSFAKTITNGVLSVA